MYAEAGRPHSCGLQGSPALRLMQGHMTQCSSRGPHSQMLKVMVADIPLLSPWPACAAAGPRAAGPGPPPPGTPAAASGPPRTGPAPTPPGTASGRRPACKASRRGRTRPPACPCAGGRSCLDSRAASDEHPDGGLSSQQGSRCSSCCGANTRLQITESMLQAAS